MSLLTRFQNLAAAGADTNPYEPATHLAFPNIGDSNAPSTTATMVFTEIDYDALPGTDKLIYRSYAQISNPSASYTVSVFDPKSRSVIQATGAAGLSGVFNLHCYNVNNVNSPSHFFSYNNIGGSGVGQYDCAMYNLSDTIHHTKKMGVVYTGQTGYAYVYNTGIGTTNEDFNDISPVSFRQASSSSIPARDVFFNSESDDIVKTTYDGAKNVIEIFSLSGSGNLGGQYSGVTYTNLIQHPYQINRDIWAKAMVRGTNYMVAISGIYSNGTPPGNDNAAVHIYDISNPASPSLVGETAITNIQANYKTEIYTATYGDYVVFFSGDVNGASTYLVRVNVVDCSDPTNPTLVTSSGVSTSSNSAVYYVNWIAWDQGSNAAYVLGQYGTNPAAPRKIEFTNNGSFVLGNSFYNTGTNTWRNTDMTNYPGVTDPGQNPGSTRGPAALYF
jgi:hypothetical protein